MNYDVLRQANSIIRGIPGNSETEITFENTFDKQRDTMQRAYDSYGIMPESKFSECMNFIHNNHLIYLGHTAVKCDGEKYLREIYVSNTEPHVFYEILLQKESMCTGDVKFNAVDYAELIKSLPVPMIQDSTELPISLESAFDYDEVDDYDFATEADLNINVTDKKPPGFGENDDQQQAGTGGEVEDITKTTAQAMGEDGGDAGQDTTDGGADTAGDMFDDNNGEEGQDGDTQSPDIMDENEDDNDDDPDDEGTSTKRRIRINMVKLHNIIKDALDAMNTFTPDYGMEVSRRYYKIRENLSTIDGILLRIINEQINDITVEELMKKYTTLCNIFDISVRAMRVFAEDYKSSLKKKH